MKTEHKYETDMNNDLVVAKVELYYQQYFGQDSIILSNGFTDFFFDKLNSISLCTKMLKEIEEPKIPDCIFRDRDEIEIDDFIWDILRKGEKYYVSYCYQYYCYLRKDKQERPDNSKEYYFNDVLWTANHNESEIEQLQHFKKGFVRPIVDYLIENLTNESVIINTLERYKARIERFKTLSSWDITKLHEKELQQDLALYLFDNNIVFSKEYDTCNGKLDFLLLTSNNDIQYGSVLECNDKPYIVEVKFFKRGADVIKLRDSIKQLHVYMGQKPSYGCLVVYTTDDTDFSLPLQIGDIKIISVYLGEKYPSERKHRKILSEFALSLN